MLEFKQKIIMKIVKTFTDIITQGDNKHIAVIRIVGDRKAVLNKYQKASELR